LSCSFKALKYTSMHYLTRTITGSAFLGAAIGGLLVYIYIGARALKFGARKSDFAVLAGTVFVVYFMST
jgi:NhaP-type Na+/H+ or K+/H+ antiporter